MDSADAAEEGGYEVTSQICEVISPAEFRPAGYPFKKLVFHAFRLTGPDLDERVVLFASPFTAAQGDTFIGPANDAAIDLHQGYSPASNTLQSPGAKEAIKCAERAGPPLVGIPGFDVEAWRARAIALFGPQTTESDGSKNDYVRTAFAICRYAMENPGQEYDTGSEEIFMINEFCPHVNTPTPPP